MVQLTPSPSIVQNIARGKSLAGRDEPLRSLDALMAGLEEFEQAMIIGKSRFAVEVSIQECVHEINRIPRVKQLIAEITGSDTAKIPYKPGQERSLRAMLALIRKGIHEKEQEKERMAEQMREERRKHLWTRGRDCLEKGERGKGKSMLRHLADEFGQEPGVLGNIASLLMHYELYYDAAEFLQQAVNYFPGDGLIYSLLVRCFVVTREYEKAEQVYLAALKQFGKHPRTMMNLAKLYVVWGKRDKAFDMALQVTVIEPDNTEAKQMVERFA